jgi:hypothetical protein
MPSQTVAVPMGPSQQNFDFPARDGTYLTGLFFSEQDLNLNDTNVQAVLGALANKTYYLIATSKTPIPEQVPAPTPSPTPSPQPGTPTPQEKPATPPGSPKKDNGKP